MSGAFNDGTLLSTSGPLLVRLSGLSGEGCQIFDLRMLNPNMDAEGSAHPHPPEGPPRRSRM